MLKKLFIIFLILFLLLFSSFKTNAFECKYGRAEEKVKLNNSKWQDSGMYDVPIEIYEPFQVKVSVETKVSCHVDIDFEEIGDREIFEVIEGPNDLKDYIHLENMPKGLNRSFVWTLRPTNVWAGGSAPLLLYIQFTKFYPNASLDNRIKEHIEKINLIHFRIGNKIWIGHHELSKKNDTIADTKDINNISGFEMILMILSIFLCIFFKKKRHN